jgi:hypothetical protein
MKKQGEVSECGPVGARPQRSACGDAQRTHPPSLPPSSQWLFLIHGNEHGLVLIHLRLALIHLRLVLIHLRRVSSLWEQVHPVRRERG